jgi:hypothetical protein
VSDKGMAVVAITLVIVVFGGFLAMVFSGVDKETPAEVSACYQRCQVLGAACDSKTDFGHRWTWSPRVAPSCECRCPQ